MNNTVKESIPMDGTLLNARSYALNKSGSKFVTIGLSPPNNLIPIIKIHGVNYNWGVPLDEWDWISLIKYKNLILDFFDTVAENRQPINEKTWTIEFLKFNNNKIIKIHRGNKKLEVCLGIESIRGLYAILPLIKYKMNMLNQQNFGKFYYNIVSGNCMKIGDPFNNINQCMVQNNSEEVNVHTMMEMMQFYPDQIISDIEDNIPNIPNLPNILF